MSETPAPQDLALTPEEATRLDAWLDQRRQPVAKRDGETAPAPLDERAQASLKAVYRILKPMTGGNGQGPVITRDDIDELMDELGLDDADDIEDDEDDAEDEGIDPGDGAEQLLDKSATNQGGPTMAKDKDDDACEKAAGGKVAWAGEMPTGAAKDKHDKAMKAAKAAYDAHVSKADDDDDEEMEKSVTKSAAPAPEPVAKAHQAIIAKCAELEQQVAEMREERVLKSLGDDLRQKLKHLPIDVDKTARVLKRLGEHDPAARDDYLATLSAANEVSKSGKAFGGSSSLFSAMGGGSTDAQGHAVQGGNAEARLNALVDGVVRKSATDGTAMSRPKALAAVINTDEGGRLYNEFVMEKRGA